jgi:hypothetical protein
MAGMSKPRVGSVIGAAVTLNVPEGESVTSKKYIIKGLTSVPDKEKCTVSPAHTDVALTDKVPGVSVGHAGCAAAARTWKLNKRTNQYFLHTNNCKYLRFMRMQLVYGFYLKATVRFGGGYNCRFVTGLKVFS